MIRWPRPHLPKRLYDHGLLSFKWPDTSEHLNLKKTSLWLISKSPKIKMKAKMWWMNFQLLPNVEILNLCEFREWDLRRSKNQMLIKLCSTSMAMATSLYQIEYSGVILFVLIFMAKYFIHRHTCLNFPRVCEIRIHLRLQKGATNELHNQTLSIQLFFFYPMDPKVASQTVQFSFFNFYWTNKLSVCHIYMKTIHIIYPSLSKFLLHLK